ncbi:hypothetical protein V7S43_013598 [Phytophthora oleae]|uniref:Uncharacterized protein n=1 Tax=Phytophthora oleae TaxID=2107226 RepID=A0ABD3F3I9_9STRA
MRNDGHNDSHDSDGGSNSSSNGTSNGSSDLQADGGCVYIYENKRRLSGCPHRRLVPSLHLTL